MRLVLLSGRAQLRFASRGWKDIVQEVFLALLRRLQLGRSHRNLRAWTFRVCGMGIREGFKRMVPSLVAVAGSGVPLFPGARKL